MSRAALVLRDIRDREADTKPCAHCGTAFARDIRNTHAYWERAKYCSQSCAGAAWSQRCRDGRLPLADKFNGNVAQSDGCWLWTGIKDRDGYGLFTYAKKQYRAPRLALELDGRPVPAGHYACHHCDNPGCVRPSHLYVGTPTDNAADTKARGRARHGKKAKVSADDIAVIRAAPGRHQDIADRFGISRSSVSMIKSGKTWRDAP